MKRVFCFALGNIWSWTKLKNRARLIKYAQKLDILGVELTMSTKEELLSFKMTDAQRQWLRNLDYVSIHAPFKLVRNSTDENDLIKQLDYIRTVYREVNAKNVIIHPNDLPNIKILSKYDMHFSTENLPKKRHITIKNLERILKKYKGMGLCLDVAHAYSWSRNETERLIRHFRDNITQIHFSGMYKGKDHVPLQSVSPTFLKSISNVKELNVPIVIEEDIRIEDLEFVKKEISYIKSLF
ncbi:TIM barrel protein [Candidatus Woesearchaeota archaeon]|nr:TIM barrel protein [Candidatus Woesearchaeota archaeon]